MTFAQNAPDSDAYNDDVYDPYAINQLVLCPLRQYSGLTIVAESKGVQMLFGALGCSFRVIQFSISYCHGGSCVRSGWQKRVDVRSIESSKAWMVEAFVVVLVQGRGQRPQLEWPVKKP